MMNREIQIKNERVGILASDSGKGFTDESGLVLFATEESGLFLAGEGGIVLTEYTFTDSRMGMPQLTATLLYPRCLDKEWSGSEYVVIRGEKYYLIDTPTSSKSNTDTRYKHELVFKSEREILANSYFYDAVPSWSSTYDKPNTNSTEFVFYGTPSEFVDRLNCALRQAKIGDSILNEKTTLTMADKPVGDGYCAVLDTDGGYDLEQSKEFSISDSYIWDVMAESFNTYEIPFEFRGKLIVFGAANRVIDRVFQYGHENELLSITKTNANAKVINRVTFKGSSENIPYYYPNESEYGFIEVEAPDSNKVLTTDKVSVANMTQLLALVEPYTKITLRSGAVDIDKAIGITSIREGFQGASLQEWRPYTFNDWVDARKNISELELTIKVSVESDYILSQVVGGVWAINTSSPGGYSNLLSNKQFFSGAFLYDASNKPVPTSVHDDGKIGLGQLAVGTYRLVLHFTNYHPLRGWIKAWAVGAIHFTNSEIGELYWECGKKKFSTLGEVGLRYDGEIGRDAIGDCFLWYAADRIPFQGNLVPPLYIDTLGEERFYDAINNKYLKEDGKTYYEFKNPLVSIPREYIYVDEDIKPTIKGIKNTSGELFGVIAGIAFDDSDNDSLSAEATDSDKNDALKYEHSFFYIKLNIFNGQDGFDLFNSASQTDAMTLQMTSGPCNGCKFKIQAYERETEGLKEFRNPVQTTGANGDIVGGDYDKKVNGENLQSWQQNTQTHSIWIAVQKDADTFGIIMPNRSHDYIPKVGDTFNITHIELPESYKRAAERRGMHAALQFMEDNNEEKFTFDITASRIFFAENPDVLSQIDVNAMLRIGYNGDVWEQFISSIEISYKNSEPLPEIKISLVNEIAAGESFVQNIVNQIDGMTQGAQLPTGGPSTEPVDTLTKKEADSRYFRKDSDDRSRNKMSTDKAFEVGEFVSGIAGGIFDIDPVTGHTRIEADYLKIRLKAIYETLELVKVSTIGGKQMITPGGGMTISFVEELSDVYRCYFKQKEDDESVDIRFVAGDQAYCQAFNLSDNTHRRYWRLVTSVNNSEAYIDLSKTDCEKAPSGESWNDVPQGGDSICQLGNRTDATRQSAIIMSTVDEFSPDITLYHGINGYTLKDKDYVSYGVDKSNPNSPRAFFKVYGDAYIGNRDGSAYMRYTPENGLEVKGKISSQSTIDDKPLDKYFDDKVSDVQSSFLVRYSATGSSDESEWHPVYRDGDVWMQTSDDGGETWSEPIRFVGADGADGSDGMDGVNGTDGVGYTTNLLLGTTERITNQQAAIASYKFGSEKPEKGKKYTMTVWGELGDTRTMFVASSEYGPVSTQGGAMLCADNGVPFGTEVSGEVIVEERGAVAVGGKAVVLDKIADGIYSAEWEWTDETADSITINVLPTMATSESAIIHAKFEEGVNDDPQWTPNPSEMIGKDGKWLMTQWNKSNYAYDPVFKVGSWKDTPPNILPGEYLWMRQGWVTPPATEPTAWMNPQRITGEQGVASGEVYTLDFSDEIIPMECSQLPDIDYVGGTKRVQIRVFKGTTQIVEGLDYTLTSEDEKGNDLCDFWLNTETGELEIYDIYEDVAPIMVMVKVDGLTLVSTISLYKVYGGADAKLYQILPSVDNITKNALGELSDETITCTVYRIWGEKIEYTSYNRLTYQILPNGTESADVPHVTNGTTAPITVPKTATGIVFTLYDQKTGMVLDRERVPVLSDASDLEVGGVNMLRNTAFFTSDKWKLTSSGVGIDSTKRFNGNNSVHMNQSGLTSNQWRGFSQGLANNENLRVNPGEYVTASIWSYSDNISSVSDGATGEIRFHNEAGDVISSFGVRIIPSKNKTWERYHASAKAPAGTYSVSLYAFVVRNGEIWIAEPQIERGNTLSDWSPSPDDYSYIAEALKNSGSIEGGLILGSTIRLGYDDNEGNKVVTAGMNGLLQEGMESRDLAFWAGGEMVDRGMPGVENGATFAIRHDGTAYAANNTVRFEENQVEVGDDVFINDEGLRLQDKDAVKVLISNKAVSSDFNAFASNVINFSKPQSTSNFYFGLNGLQTVITQHMTPIRIPVNGVKKGDVFSININAHTTHSMDFSPSASTPNAFPKPLSSLFSIRLSASDGTKIFDFPVPCSSEITNNSRPYQRKYTVSQRYSATAYVDGDYMLEIYFTVSGTSAPIKSTSTLYYTVDGNCRTLGTNQTLLGSNGFSSIWTQSAFAVNDDGIILRVGDVGIKITSEKIAMTYDGGNTWEVL